MNKYHYDDPIENFNSDDYFAQKEAFVEQHSHGSYTNVATGKWYDDEFDLEYDLSSPSLIGSKNWLYFNHHGFQQPIMNPCKEHYSEKTVLQDIQIAGNSPRNFSGALPSSNQRANGASSSNCDEQDPNSSYSIVNFRQPTKSIPRNTHSVRLRPVSDLPDKFRSLFKFGVFNAVQSTCFDEVFNGDKNLVISAPTGSGKTVLFELAMINTLERAQNKPVKCIYIAPTKALCSEKVQDWAVKFEPLGFKCCELTGDTVVFGHSAWGDAKHASIIVTTCEKWDSLTRSWNDHKQTLSQIELFLIDEVHILNEQRGSILEVVTSRMKLRLPSVRFILVSATVPNIHDVAQWICIGPEMSEPAKVFQFGDDYRPCKLTRHVVGVHRKNGQNDFQFAKILDYRLFAVLQQYSVGKPVLIFCQTRKGVFGTAEQLSKEYVDNESKKATLPWSRPPRIGHSFSDKRLDEFAAVGIGVHHAGLTMDDRRATEKLYLDKVLRILVATSTLAVGVNLPAHMVVIKGVHMFQNNTSKEYSDLDVMQMLGRAGRPQFDKDGVAVIMCEAELESKYRTLVQGKTVLESSLHLNLSEHLNSEIGLGTITDLSSAKHWLHNSFLYQRMQRNPQHYAIFNADGHPTTNVDDLVIESIERLKKAELVEVEDPRISEKLWLTQYGEIMSKYYIRRTTMEKILSLPARANVRDMLETICTAEEFYDCKLRVSEKPLFNKLRKDADIRFEVKKVEKTADKIFLLVQAVLGGISFSSPEYKTTESQPHMEAFAIFKHIARIARAVLDVAVVKKDGAQSKNGLELFRCLSAKAWEDRAIVLRQIEHLGEKSIKVLAEHGITSVAELRKQDPLRIETLLNRRPPFGLEILASAFDIPQYTLGVQELEVTSDGGRNPVEIRLKIECSLVEDKNAAVKARRSRSRNFDRTSVLTLTSDMDFIDFRRIPTKSLRGGKSFELDVELKKPSQNVIIMITSETVAGTATQQIYKPHIPPSEYPVMDTRPLSSMEMDLIGLEDDPDFWNMTLESDSPERKPNQSQKDFNNEDTEKDMITSKSLVTRGLDSAPPKRADGRYDCNHSCRDKSKCRHFCCRDGLTNPPSTRKNDQRTEDPQEAMPKKPLKVQRVQVGTKGSGATRENKSLKELDITHERAQAVNNFQLPKGQQRLKMMSPPILKRKRPPAEYDIHFTDLKDPKDAIHSSDIPDNLSDDDLPESIVPASTFPETNVNHKKLSQYPIPEVLEPTKKRLRRDVIDSTRKLPPEKKMQLFLLDSETSDHEGSIEIGSPIPAISFSDPVSKQSSMNVDSASGQITLPDTMNSEELMDEFAELEAWLESGSYEIV